MYHQNALHAIKEAYIFAPSVVAYSKGNGWVTYDPTKPLKNVEPEFFVPKLGVPPVPLNEHAIEVWWYVVRSLHFLASNVGYNN